MNAVKQEIRMSEEAAKRHAQSKGSSSAAHAAETARWGRGVVQTLYISPLTFITQLKFYVSFIYRLIQIYIYCTIISPDIPLLKMVDNNGKGAVNPPWTTRAYRRTLGYPIFRNLFNLLRNEILTCFFFKVPSGLPL